MRSPSRLKQKIWFSSHITDLKLLIHEKSYKTYDKELKDNLAYS